MGQMMTAFFLARGRSLTVCQEFLAETEAVRTAFRTFMKDCGGCDYVTAGSYLIGLKFPGIGPDDRGWRKVVDSGLHFWRPNCRTKAGRRLSQTIHDLPSLPVQWGLAGRFGVQVPGRPDTGFVEEGDWAFVRATVEGGPEEFVIHVKFSDAHPLVPPPDSTELTATQYQAWRSKRLASGNVVRS